jgi:Amt family ammonium transporter
VGSGLGVHLLSFFIRDSRMATAALAAGGTWSSWNQLGIQLAGMGATIALAATGTFVIYFVVEKTVGFRIDESRELMGLDRSLHSEHGYGLVNSDVSG